MVAAIAMDKEPIAAMTCTALTLKLETGRLLTLPKLIALNTANGNIATVAIIRKLIAQNPL